MGRPAKDPTTTVHIRRKDAEKVSRLAKKAGKSIPDYLEQWVQTVKES